MPDVSGASTGLFLCFVEQVQEAGNAVWYRVRSVCRQYRFCGRRCVRVVR